MSNNVKPPEFPAAFDYLSYFGIFIFVAIWIVQYAMGKYNVKKMNEILYKKPEKNKEKK